MTTVDRQVSLAVHYLEAGRPRDALRILDDMPSEMVAQPEYWLIRSGAHFGLGEWEQGATAAQRGLAARSRGHGPAQHRSRSASSRTARTAPPTRRSSGRSAIEPENPVLLANRALVLARMREFPEARALVDKAVGPRPRGRPTSRRCGCRSRCSPGIPVRSGSSTSSWRRTPENEIAHALQGNLAVKNSQVHRGFTRVRRGGPARARPTQTSSERRGRRVSRRIHFSRRCGLILRVGWFPAKVVLLVVFVGLNAAGYHTLASVAIVAWFGPDRVLPGSRPGIFAGG